MKEKILSLMKECVDDINSRIVKSNDDTDKKSNHLFKPLVYLAQTACDKILVDPSKNFLERILLCAKTVNAYGAGNCMMQSFVALDQLIKRLLAEKLITMEKALPIAICTTKDHTFIMVDGLVCDPWAKYYGAFETCPSAQQKIDYYFYIDSAWNCYDDNSYDESSTAYTFKLVSEFAPKTNDTEELQQTHTLS